MFFELSVCTSAHYVHVIAISQERPKGTYSNLAQRSTGTQG